jgi:hypothetical protein
VLFRRNKEFLRRLSPLNRVVGQSESLDHVSIRESLFLQRAKYACLGVTHFHCLISAPAGTGLGGRTGIGRKY